MGKELIPIRFVEQARRPKSRVWKVGTAEDTFAETLGFILWHGTPINKYGFYPEPDTVWEESHLRQIADFIEARSKEHKAPYQYKESHKRFPNRKLK